MPPLTTICILLFLLGTGICHELDCKFDKKCCWNGDETWQIKGKDDFNINEFRRTFLVGRTRPPPEENYLVRAESGGGGNYTSCPLCSADGAVVVQFRHWQSPTARLRLCYRFMDQSSPRECQLALASRQSQITSYLFRVPRAQKIQLYFSAESTESSSSSVIMLDLIRVQFMDCHYPTMIPPRPSKKNYVQASKMKEERTGLKSHDSSKSLITRFSSSSSSRPMHIKKIKKVSAKDTTLQTVVPPQSTSTDTVPQIATIPKSTVSISASPSNSAPPLPKTPLIPPSPAVGSSDNPLNDLLGEELANFLDPNYVTNDVEEDDEDEDVSDVQPVPPKNLKPVQIKPLPLDDHAPTHLAVTNVQPKLVSGSIVVPGKPVKVEPPPPLSEFHRPLPLGVPGTCNTVGGCLFENGFCSWKTPSDVPLTAQFQLSRVGQSTFAQARVPSGEVSIIQVDTKFAENHTILFDALEYQTGSRLIGCCFQNSNLHCPFATPSQAGAVLWQISKFECPINTEKLIFICENYGTEPAICGIDNIRLHRSTDIFFFEPCQKNTLSSL